VLISHAETKLSGASVDDLDQVGFALACSQAFNASCATDNVTAAPQMVAVAFHVVQDPTTYTDSTSVSAKFAEPAVLARFDSLVHAQTGATVEVQPVELRFDSVMVDVQTLKTNDAAGTLITSRTAVLAVGLAVGLALLCCCCLLIGFCICARRRKKKRRDVEPEHAPADAEPGSKHLLRAKNAFTPMSSPSVATNRTVGTRDASTTTSTMFPPVEAPNRIGARGARAPMLAPAEAPERTAGALGGIPRRRASRDRAATGGFYKQRVALPDDS
jgi:hypothetical protein